MVSFTAFMRGTVKWVSEAQEKGMKALQLHLQKAGRLTDWTTVWTAIAWLIQKEHESQEWLVKLFGDQLSSVENEIKKLQEEISKISAIVRALEGKKKDEREAPIGEAEIDGKGERKQPPEAKSPQGGKKA